MSDLRHTRVARNIGISLTHWGFELFDLVLIVFAIIVLGFVGRFIHRNLFGVDLSMLLQFGLPIVGAVALRLFKYGKPRRYLLDLIDFHFRPTVYCALEPDRQQTTPYLKD